MPTSIQLTNGAAFAARGILTKGLHSIEDIFAGGSLALMLKPAKLPKPNEGESQADYGERLDTWTEEPFTPIEVEPHHLEALKIALLELSAKKELICNEAVIELLKVAAINKKPA